MNSFCACSNRCLKLASYLEFCRYLCYNLQKQIKEWNMSRKTFISYKYSDVVENRENNNLRDRIIEKLGDGARFYRGEDGYSRDLSSFSANYIKQTLKSMIRDTSVTIVILSPNMKMSNWMNWEITYSLTEISSQGRTSLTNGVVCVVQKQPTYYLSSDGYSWLKGWNGEWDLNKCFEIIRKNRNNKKYYAIDTLSPHYIDIVTEEMFLRNPDKYIEEAYSKAHSNDYNISKQGGIW